MRPGAVAAIHANQAKKLRAELARIEKALDVAKVEDADKTSDRVVLALTELAQLRRRIEDIEWEAAGRAG